MKEKHKEVIRMLIKTKHNLRRLLRLSRAAIAKRTALESRGVVSLPDEVQTLAGSINTAQETIFGLVSWYDKTTVTPNVHERAQLLGVSHIALNHHRAYIEGSVGKPIDKTLMTDVIQHGEIACERGLESIWECTARDYPLFNACSVNLVNKVKIPDSWFEQAMNEMNESRQQAKQDRRKHLRVI